MTNAFGASKDPRDSGSPYGVLAFLNWNHDWNSFHFKSDQEIERAAALMKDAGIRWARMDFLWADVEPEQGRFDFARYDRIINILQANGVRILGLLDYNPAWRGGMWNDAPDPDAYLAYARATVRHFKDRVRYWEIWNEPDHENYWQPQDNLNAYAELLKRAAPAIRAEDPTAKIVMGGLSGHYEKHVRHLYETAGRESFDIVNIHPFVNPLMPKVETHLAGLIADVRNVMTNYGDAAKPIWITEIGCPGLASKEESRGWWLEHPISEEEQAEWLKNVYRISLAQPGVQKVFWAFLRDTPNHFQNDIDAFGLLRENFTPKPAYSVLQKLASPQDL